MRQLAGTGTLWAPGTPEFDEWAKSMGASAKSALALHKKMEELRRQSDAVTVEWLRMQAQEWREARNPECSYALLEAAKGIERGDHIPGAVDAEKLFCDAVWAALKGDHSDLRKQALILKAHRAAQGMVAMPETGEDTGSAPKGDQPGRPKADAPNLRPKDSS